MLGVDADNHTGAVELYQSLGMSPVIEGLLYELPYRHRLTWCGSSGPSPAGSIRSASNAV